MPRFERTGQNQILQAAATAQGHIGLTVRECAAPEINHNLIEGLTLAFMNGQGPGKLQRQLGKRADAFALQSVCLFVIGVAVHRPGIGLNAYQQPLLCSNKHVILIKFHNMPERTINPQTIAVVGREHNLCSGLKLQLRRDR